MLETARIFYPVPGDELEALNDAIVGEIEIVATFP